MLVKHLARAGLSMDPFEILLVTADEAGISVARWWTLVCVSQFGVGDVTSGLLLVKLLQGAQLRDALEHVTAAVYEIMLATKNMQEYELQVVAARIMCPAGALLQRHATMAKNCRPRSRAEDVRGLNSFRRQRRGHRWTSGHVFHPGRDIAVTGHIQLHGPRPAQYGKQVAIPAAMVKRCPLSHCFSFSDSSM